jgi:hypothetical protein
LGSDEVFRDFALGQRPVCAGCVRGGRRVEARKTTSHAASRPLLGTPTTTAPPSVCMGWPRCPSTGRAA